MTNYLNSSMTRREFLKKTGIVVGGLMVVGGLSGLGKIVYDAEFNSNPDKRHMQDVVEAVKIIPKGEGIGSVYLGNVNDFDNRIGSSVALSIDPSRMPPFQLPSYVIRPIQTGQDEIRVLYLDSGFGNPYRQDLDKTLQVVETGIKEIMHSVSLSISADVLPWKFGMQIVHSGISNVETPEEFIEGKAIYFASDKKYLLLIEDPRMVEEGIAGAAHLRSNFSAVELPQQTDAWRKAFFYKAILQELGHSYGLPHCWEEACPMSYAFLKENERIEDSSHYGDRCRMIGSNIVNGDVVIKQVPFDPEGHSTKKIYIGFLQSARSVPEPTAKSDLENHLMRYLFDVAPTIRRIDNLELETILGKEKDEVVFYGKYPLRGREELARATIVESIDEIVA